VHVKKLWLVTGWLICVATSLVYAQGNIPVKVLGQRVNLRAKALPEAEVVGQVSENDVLTAKSVGDEWVEVVPPENVDLWVHRDFVREGTATANKLYVRSGPGINYTVVGTMNKGDTFTVRGEFGEWIKIAPPPSCSVWVNRQFVQVVQPEKPRLPEVRPGRPLPPPVETPPTETSTAPLEQTPVETPVQPVQPSVQPQLPTDTAEAITPPKDLVLIPLEGQGRYVQREGELRLVGFVFGSPSRFRLVRYEGNKTIVICYVRGNNTQLRSFIGKTMLIRGREYWVKGADYPVVVPEQIVPRAEPSTR
jgi:SH3-like domain-containing protein